MKTALTLAFAFLLALPQEESSNQDPLIFGMSTALTGPAASLGTNMRDGVEAAFAEAVVRGRKLELRALDDGYEPKQTGPNMHDLIEQEDILGVIGNVGTPTAIVSVPIANAANTLFFGAYTGAGALRQDPADHAIINYRASYAEETGAMVDGLIKEGGLAPEEIAFFTQADGYGDAGFNGGIEALFRHGLKDKADVTHGRYKRNTVVVENALADIMLARTTPKAVIMVGAYAPCSKFILMAHEMGLEAVFLNVSFVGTQPLAESLGTGGDGVIITQVVPHFDSELRIATEYKAAMDKAFGKNAEDAPTWTASFGSFEGYIAARILSKGLSDWDGDLDRAGVIDALESLAKFDIGLGIDLKINRKEHQASHEVWPTVLRDGKAVPFAWSELKSR